MANRICNWDYGIWNHGRWSGYSATWDNAVWNESFWSLVWLGKLQQIIDELEKMNIGTYVFEAGCVEPGIDNVDVPLRNLLDNLES